MPALDETAIRDIIAKMIIFILSIAVHEFGHAFVADRLGDTLPRSQGRVTLNPFAHADPIGTLALPALALILSGGAGFGFGWGRPVMVSPLSFTRKFRMKTSHMMVAAAGPAMNILFGIVISLVLLVLLKTGTLSNPSLIAILHDAIFINFLLAVFNLFPAPPLDGGTVLAGLLPDRYQQAYQQYAQYGIFVIMAVVMTRLNVIFRVPAEQLYYLWVGILGLA